jgi:SPX domain protein involved in polyphosphate accumulation
MERDRYAIPLMGNSYPIYSLYLDDPGLSLYGATRQGQKNRYKLRVRYYDHEDASPVFFEIKRRVNEVILKERAAVKRESLARLMAGCCPTPQDLVERENTGDYFVLRRFCELRGAIHAEPKVLVYYEREAWVSPGDEQLRVTFDREAAAARYEGSLRPEKWIDPQVPGVVLELKFTDRFPLWMQDLVRSWDLYRTTMGKYVLCVDRLPKRTQERMRRVLI